MLHKSNNTAHSGTVEYVLAIASLYCTSCINVMAKSEIE